MMKVAKSCPILCDPMDYSLPGSAVHGILQARILQWVAIPSSRGSPRDWTQVSHTVGRFFNSWATREAPSTPMVGSSDFHVAKYGQFSGAGLLYHPQAWTQGITLWPRNTTLSWYAPGLTFSVCFPLSSSRPASNCWHPRLQSRASLPSLLVSQQTPPGSVPDDCQMWISSLDLSLKPASYNGLHISSWMASRYLELNMPKAKFLIHTLISAFPVSVMTPPFISKA